MSTAKRAYDMLRGYVNREWERLQGVEMTDAERELHDAIENPAPRSSTAESKPEATADQAAIARQVLGVSEGATFADIRKSYERIAGRSDPANFPAGSPEAAQAEQIHRRVHRAYAILTEGMDATEKRFRSLEID